MSKDTLRDLIRGTDGKALDGLYSEYIASFSAGQPPYPNVSRSPSPPSSTQTATPRSDLTPFQNRHLRRVNSWNAAVDATGTASLPPTPKNKRTASIAGTVAPDDSISSVSRAASTSRSETTTTSVTDKKMKIKEEPKEKPVGQGRISQGDIVLPYATITADAVFKAALSRYIYLEDPFYAEETTNSVPRRVVELWKEACKRLNVDADLLDAAVAAENTRRLVCLLFAIPRCRALTSLLGEAHL
jgi:hypothetical protein